jgi:hypothetical protein
MSPVCVRFCTGRVHASLLGCLPWYASVVTLLLNAGASVNQGNEVSWVLCGAAGAPLGVRARAFACVHSVQT